MHSHMVAFLQTKALEGKLKSGHIRIAEHDAEPRTQLGYSISQDKYLGHEDLGVFYQLNVMPVRQRHLVGATLVKHAFEKSPYGCRLFCCWCAQDIQANYFWESLGFIPLAFRAGGRSKQRTQIFWQRRVREDDTVTPYWYPFETKSGMIREDRLAFPIPRGVHWRDAKPMILPGQEPGGELTPLALPDKRAPRPKKPVVQKVAVVVGGRIKYLDRANYLPPSVPAKAAPTPAGAPRAPKPKYDPKLTAMTRELRDRYLEHVNNDPSALPAPGGKYVVVKQIDVPTNGSRALLEAA
jgi:hypothetical protein